MRLKIVSDGSAANTYFVNDETGERIKLRVTKINWTIDANPREPSECVLTLANVALEYTGQVTLTHGDQPHE